ncbi:MAG: VWA domain-containing protein [Roseovarius sp.]|uniref:VWA domain-containing protein n=2 Tax=Roseovarius sp. TaxID=1486281 RepID=UPI0032EDA688
MSSFYRKAVLATGLAFAATTATAQENVMVVFDGSNSMWGQIDGTAKIEIARDVMDTLLGEWTEEREVGLMAYGHRRRGDCGDIETLVQPGAQTRATILEQVGGITPTGKTPLTDAVERAATELAYTDRPATVVLISDGLESCERDPCELARALEQGGVGFTAHVVGFGLGADQDDTSLSCIAEETGGTYIQASNAEELKAAMSSVSTAVADTTPDPEPALPEVTVTGPGTAIGGSIIEVTWDPTAETGDFLTIVPAGTAATEHGETQSVNEDKTVNFTVPADQGMYEIRYIHADGEEVLGTDALEITRPEVVLTGPEMVLTGEDFTAGWSPTINPNDYVTIVPTGAETGASASYVTVRDKSEGELSAPADPGFYELRYVLSVDKRTVATRAIEVAAPEVTLDIPETALAGSKFPVRWTGTVNAQDYITVVPAGTKEGEFGNYFVVRDASENQLQAAAETGLYEVRYVLREGNKTLASAPIEITAPEVTVTGPETAQTGSKFPVSWTGAVSGNDYVTIVPTGTDEGEFGNYIVVRDKTENQLQAPAETGMYEIRYVLREGNKTLATTPIEITAPAVTVTAPETAATGSKFPVSWTGTVSSNDYITIVPTGTDEGEFGNYITVRDRTENQLQAPAETGMYEIRYVLREGNKTLATTPIEITAPEVTVDAPDTALTGEKFMVSWTGTVNNQDYVTIVPAGTAEGEFGNYITVRDRTENQLQAPAETGMYEVRYVLREGGKTLATDMIEITAPEVTVTAPETALAGSAVRVSWAGTVSNQDYIAIVPAGADEGEFGNYITVRDRSENDVRAPSSPGLYEIRYILREGGKTLATRPIEITEPEVTVSGPSEVRATDTLKVSWTGTVDPGDYVALAPMGSGDDDFSNYFSVRDQTERDMKAPETPGMYELRYILREGGRVLARQPVEVLDADAALNSGAELTAPDTAAPGSTIDVGWTVEAESADQRITIAAADQAIFTWIEAVKITGDPPVSLTLPDDPGIYELRFLDVSNQQVLARKVIAVE